MTSKTDRDYVQLLFESFAHEIDTFHRERFGCESRYTDPAFPTISINCTAVHLYIRFRLEGFWPSDSVVIASIGFGKKRRGHGRELLRKLVEMSNRYGFESIGIEQTGQSESINNFVRKFNFRNYKNDKNWIVSVDVLTACLASLPPQRARRYNRLLAS